MAAASAPPRFSPGIRFAPTDADVVLGFLLPCLRDGAPAADGLLLRDDADPFAAPPDVLLRADGDALFLVLGSKRPAGDTGAWRKQRVTKGAAVSEDGEAVAWRKEAFVYGADGDHGDAGGLVMDRFRMLDAKKGQEVVLCRVKKAMVVKKLKNGQEPPSIVRRSFRDP